MMTSIEKACREFLNRTEPHKESYQQLTKEQGEEFIRRCELANLNPNKEGVTAYNAKGKLVMVVHHDTYVRRAAGTGEFASIKSWVTARASTSRVDKDGVVHEELVYIAHAEVVRRRFVSNLDLHEWVKDVTSAEVNVGQWQKAMRGPTWKTMPETMAMKCARVEALKEAFPEVLYGLPDGVGDVVDAPTSSPGNPPDLVQAARDKMGEERDPMEEEGARQANARITREQWQAFFGQECGPRAYDESDAASIVKRVWDCEPRDLNNRKLEQLVKIMAQEPAARVPYERAEELGEAFMALGFSDGALKTFAKDWCPDGQIMRLRRDKAQGFIAALEKQIAETRKSLGADSQAAAAQNGGQPAPAGDGDGFF